MNQLDRDFFFSNFKEGCELVISLQFEGNIKAAGPVHVHCNMANS